MKEKNQKKDRCRKQCEHLRRKMVAKSAAELLMSINLAVLLS